ncbi:MAG: ATP-binding protein [Phycisphaerae bacterium]
MCNPTECRYLSQATQLLVTVDEAGAIRSTDPRRAQVLGHDLSRLTGRSLSDLVVEDERPHLSRLLDQTQHAPAVWERLTFARSDGRAEPLLCCFQRIRDGDTPPGTVLVAGLALESLGRRLQSEAAAALGRVAFACHSPAHRLMQALEAVLAECPASQAVHRCRDDLEHLLDALSQASAWPKTDGRPVDAVAVVEAVLETLDGDAGFARLRADLRPESPAAWTSVHPAALAYVTLHLAANARDATSRTPSPHLHITVAAEEGRVVLEFQDNGPGIRPEERDRAFAPCAAGPCDGDRAGMGLASCRQLLAHFGGTLHLHGRCGGGTTAVVTLPAARTPA